MSNNNIFNSQTNQDIQREKMIKREEFKALRERLKNKYLPDLENISDLKLRELVKLVLNKNVIITTTTRDFYKRKIKNILREYEGFMIDNRLTKGKKKKRKKRRSNNRLRGRSIKRQKRGRGSKKMRR